MTDLLKRAENALARMHKASVSQDVVYQRGGSTVTLKATMGSTQMGQYDQGGAVIAFDSIDFLVNAADLVLNGDQVEPRRGDEIIWRGHNYRVVADQQGDRPYRESGSEGTVLRVMTKRSR